MIQQAKEVLETNWRGGFTVPTDKLYPFQWNWDSGFVALGWARLDLSRAIAELRSLFSGQWGNGLLPHIIFHSESEETYFPNFDFWNSQINPTAPEFPKSSGITQPAVHGFILEELHQLHPDSQELNELISELIPKICLYHSFLYEHRDPYNEGLIFTYHPWESGRDNSPVWDSALDSIVIKPGDIPSYSRRDTSIANSDERPTQDQYDRYVYLLELGKRHAYQGQSLYEETPFAIQDCMMNAILYKSNQSLLRLAEKFDYPQEEILTWVSRTKQSFNKKLWHDKMGCWVSYDLKRDGQIEEREIGGIIPVATDLASQDQVNRISDYLIRLKKRGFSLCPSYDVDSPKFDSKRYWRGPIWPHMNALIAEGLEAQGESELAKLIDRDTLQIVDEYGFFEYFDCQQDAGIKSGYGGDQFSWTASSIIRILERSQ